MAASFFLLRFSHPRRLLLPLLMLSLHLYSVLSNAPPPHRDCSTDFRICSPFNYTDATPGCGMNVISCRQGSTWISLFNQSFCVRHISYNERKIDIDYNQVSLIREQLCNRNLEGFEAERSKLFKRGVRFSIPQIAVFICGRACENPETPKEVACGDDSASCFVSLVDPQFCTNWSGYENPAPSIPLPGGMRNETFSLQWDYDCDSGCSNLPGCHGEDGYTKLNNCEVAGKGKGHKDVPLGIILGVVLPFVILVTCLILFLCFRNRTRKRQPQVAALFNTCSTCSSRALNQPSLESTSFYRRCRNVTIFSYEELVKATGGFSPSNELGDGGFGIVYYGVLCDGRKVAVKRLFEHNFNRVEQFMNEIEILSTIKHENLVELYGCTTRNSRELLLVYEYVDNGTLGDHLNGSRASDRCLTWKLRLNIAVKTAEALAYLHQLKPPIIHRDVKSSNILLDENFHVKVSDFGMSRLFPSDVSHVSTIPQGTPGYIDPRYHQCYQLTDKSDVYSFGVVLMELISSLPAVDIMRPRDEVNLANMALNMIRNNALNEFVDSSLGFQSDYLVQKSVGAVAELAFSCLSYDMEVRPTMNEVAETLRQIQAQVQKSEKNKPSFQALLKSTVFLKSRAQSSPNPVDDKQSTNPNIVV